MRVTASLPSPASLRSPLRNITEAFAAELGRPSDRPPDWSDLEWRLARAVAVMHGVSPLLAQTLRWPLPVDFRRFIDEQREQTRRRQGRIAQLLEAIGGQARASGVPVQPLKGAALHALGIYQPGERPMADLDLLVRKHDVDAAVRMLRALGYREVCVTWKHRALEPAAGPGVTHLGEHADHPIKIDLHQRIVEMLPRRLTGITAAVASGHAAPGLNGYPSRAALLLHLLLHAAGSMVNNAIRLIHLQDIARVSVGLAASDWERIATLSVNARGLPWAFPPLALTARYFPAVIPPHVLDALGRRCPRLLRRVARRQVLSDVSYSEPFVSAAPGLAWSTSVGEMLGYLVGRVTDGRDAEFDHAARSEAWASESEWFGVSQARRVLTWATSRPPRVQTMYSVREALRQIS